MKNKGFTLVELLATIVVIALISGIAVVSYNSIHNRTRKKVYETYEDGMKVAIQELVIDEPNLLGVRVPLSYLTGQSSGGITYPLPSDDPYMDLIKNPNDKTDYCLGGSYAKAEIVNNKTIITVCLRCTHYQSSSC